MANQQTRSLAKRGLGTRMMKGQQSPTNAHSSYAVVIERPVFKGVHCPTHFGCVGNGRKQAWRGSPSPLLSFVGRV